jgi:hypothetical protein
MSALHPRAQRSLDIDQEDAEMPDLIEADDDDDDVDADELNLPHLLEEDEEDERDIELHDAQNLLEAQEDLQRIRQEKKQRRPKKKTKIKNPGSVSRALTVENKLFSSLNTPCCKKLKCYKRYHCFASAHFTLSFSTVPCQSLTHVSFEFLPRFKSQHQRVLKKVRFFCGLSSTARHLMVRNKILQKHTNLPGPSKYMHVYKDYDGHNVCRVSSEVFEFTFVYLFDNHSQRTLLCFTEHVLHIVWRQQDLGLFHQPTSSI